MLVAVVLVVVAAAAVDGHRVTAWLHTAVGGRCSPSALMTHRPLSL